MDQKYKTKWVCPKCGASGMIELNYGDDIETKGSNAITEAHRIASPDCKAQRSEIHLPPEFEPVV